MAPNKPCVPDGLVALQLLTGEGSDMPRAPWSSFHQTGLIFVLTIFAIILQTFQPSPSPAGEAVLLLPLFHILQVRSKHLCY